MHIPLVQILSLCFVCFFVSAFAAPFDTSNFGVYRSDAAQSYFSDRFGSSFLSGLAAKLRQISSGRKSNTDVEPRRAKAVAPKIQFVTSAPEKETTTVRQQAPLYRDAIAPVDSMNAKEIQSFSNPNDYYYYDNYNGDYLLNDYNNYDYVNNNLD